MNIRKPIIIAIALALASSGVARADEVSDLKAQMEAMGSPQYWTFRSM